LSDSSVPRNIFIFLLSRALLCSVSKLSFHKFFLPLALRARKCLILPYSLRGSRRWTYSLCSKIINSNSSHRNSLRLLKRRGIQIESIWVCFVRKFQNFRCTANQNKSVWVISRSQILQRSVHGKFPQFRDRKAPLWFICVSVCVCVCVGGGGVCEYLVQVMVVAERTPTLGEYCTKKCFRRHSAREFRCARKCWRFFVWVTDNSYSCKIYWPRGGRRKSKTATLEWKIFPVPCPFMWLLASLFELCMHHTAISQN
jgi:hypothetical protein